jgi:TonB family protein
MHAVDIEPRFKNQSANAFASWVNARLKYPKDAKAEGIEGTVVLKFVIGTNGGVQEIEVEQGVYPSLDAEAVRVVRNSPKWRPAVKDGKPVRFTYHFPVIFVIP